MHRIRSAFSLVVVLILVPHIHGQIPYQVIPLTADVEQAPPAITLQWPADPNAMFFHVKKRTIDQGPWELLAELPGTATQYVDASVAIGEHWEYSVSSSAPLPSVDTLCITPGSEITFTIHDTGGNGLCCRNSAGFWEIYACGTLIARGAEYGSMDQAQFMMCGSADCEELVVRVFPDNQFEEVSWVLTRDMDMVLASGAPDMAPMFGYIVSGIATPPVESQGTLLLLVEQALADDLEEELDRLRLDLIGEGWLVVRQDVAAGVPVPAVKELVLDAASTSADLSALFLIGNIPVPYSGKIAPDEHDDHLGAWPADLYYAELDGPWTDEELDWTSPNVQPRNHNVPGDGKFDQSTLPSDVDLIMGRIDFSNLPVYSEPAVELIRSYLDRDHAFRTGQLTFSRKAVIDEHFPWLDHESAVYRSCIPMVGQEAVQEGPFLSTLAEEPHLWAMAGGPGMYHSAMGVATAAEVAATPLKGAFAHLLGSYFGDWDITNNFMRSTLASGTMLGVVWGLQEMTFHQMALGLTMGECVRRSQNSHYDLQERHGRLVHLALHGDPTLRLLPARQVESLELDSTPGGVQLNWSPVDEPIIGYHIYRRNDPEQHFERITEETVVGTAWFDPSPITGGLQYMVRPLKLETTASGSYQVLGTGTMAHIDFIVGLDHQRSLPEVRVYPSPNAGQFMVELPEPWNGASVRLVDLTGKEVPARYMRRSGAVEVHTEASDGIYMLVIGGDRTIHRSITIAR